MYNKKFYKKMLLMSISIFLIATLTIGTISMVSAKDITIDSNTSGGLKKAISTVKNGDTIYLNNGVYSGRNNTRIITNKNINIRGNGSNVVIDGEGKNPFLKMTGKKVSLQKITFTNGFNEFTSTPTNFGHEVIISVNCQLTVRNCIFTNNIAYQGGAIYSWSGKLTVNNCKFINNTATRYDGTINCEDGVLIVSKSTFKDNTARAGGAIALGFTVGGREYSIKSTINNCVFTNNTAKEFAGGAIFTHGNTIISNCSFSDNKAVKFGGAIYNVAKNKVEVSDSKFTNNKIDNKYNAIYTWYKSNKVSLKNVHFSPKKDSVEKGNNKMELLIADPVSPVVNNIEKGNFKVEGNLISYEVKNTWNYNKNKLNKNEVAIIFYKGKFFQQIYLLKKTKKTQIKSFYLSEYIKGKPQYKNLKTYITTKSVENFYFKNYKPEIIKKVKIESIKW